MDPRAVYPLCPATPEQPQTQRGTADRLLFVRARFMLFGFSAFDIAFVLPI